MISALEKYEYVKGYRQAPLPVRYETAKKALAECESLDECREWKDKSEALRSYARQANDDELYRMATKIQNRARVRMGELIRQVEKANVNKKRSGGVPTSSRRALAQEAGLSKDQANEAKAMSRVPTKVREEMIERGATATEIAEEGRNYDDKGSRRGRKVQCARCKGLFLTTENHDCTPEGYVAATRLIGDLSRLAEFLQKQKPRVLADAMNSQELRRAIKQAGFIRAWLDNFKKAGEKR